MKIHHLGIAVASLPQAVEVFSALLQTTPCAEETIVDQKVRTALFQVGESRIELLQPLEPDSAVGKFIAKRGAGIHHVTLSTPHLEAKLRALEQSGFRLIDREPRVGAGGEKIAFLHPSSTAGILIELVEERSKPEGGEE